MSDKQRISGKQAARVAEDMAKRGPIRVIAGSEVEQQTTALVPSDGPEQTRKAPPRVRKPSPLNDQCIAPTPDLESHRKRLREAFGNTMSDEFVDVILGNLVEALRPGLYDQLEEATLNAALATIDSMQPQSELQALMAVQIVAVGSCAQRFLQQSHRHMTEPTRDGTVGRSDATERNLPVHRDIDPARVMRPRFADSIRASSPSGLREQAGHMTASDFCAARYIFSCQAGAIHT